jgi:hypothetical protein
LEIDLGIVFGRSELFQDQLTIPEFYSFYNARKASSSSYPGKQRDTPSEEYTGMQMPESRQKKTFSRRKSNRSLTCCVIKS